MEGINGNKIHESLCNVYTKVISWSNVYKWIKKFNEGCMERHNAAQLSDSINEETCGIVSCLHDNDLCITISNLHHEIAAPYTFPFQFSCLSTAEN